MLRGGRGYPVHADWAKQSNRVRDLLVHSFKAALFLFWGSQAVSLGLFHSLSGGGVASDYLTGRVKTHAEFP